MNVYILTKEPFPHGMAAVQRIKCYAKSILLENINCKVIVYSRSSTKSTLPYKGIIDDIPYQFVGKSSRRAKGVLGRIQSFLIQLWLPLFIFKKIKKGDIVFGYGIGNMHLWKFLIFLIHKKKGFYVSELCELPYGTSIETPESIKNREYLYKHLFPIYDGFIPISVKLEELAYQYCNPECIVQKIPILVDYDKYNLPNNSSTAKYPYIFHSGTLYEQKDGILGMIEAFGIATQKLDYKIHFVLTGNIEKSPHSKEILGLIEKYQLYNVIHFTGYLSDDELRNQLSKSSLVIINKYTTLQNNYCFSTKLGEYMAAGKPLIITRVGEAINWLTDNHDCLIVEPYNISQMSDAIIKIFSDSQLSEKLGNQARNTCINYFDYRNYGKKLILLFHKLIENNNYYENFNHR